MLFTQFRPVHQVEQGDDYYSDAVNHCKNYKSYLVSGSKVSSVHECTHGINADLRNGAIAFQKSGLGCGLPKPFGRTEYNAFYVLNDRAVKIQEPSSKITDCHKYIPSSMRYNRYNLYLVQQASQWNDTPLYVYDEWVAYCNGADAVIDLSKRGLYTEGDTDYIFAPLEFVTYGVATLMAAGQLDPTLRAFSIWSIIRSFLLYFEGVKITPWGDADKCYEQLRTASECNDIRTFMKSQLELDIPDKNNPTPLPLFN